MGNYDYRMENDMGYRDIVIKYIPPTAGLWLKEAKPMVVSPWGNRYRGQSQSGYGQKITTDYMVEINSTLYRVYATCWSNAASHWIRCKGETLHLPNLERSDFRPVKERKK